MKLYRTLLAGLPSSIGRDRADIAAILAEQLRNARGPTSAVGVLMRAFGRLPVVVVLEWIDAIRGKKRAKGGDAPSRVRAAAFFPNLRFAGRTLRKSPAFAWAAVLLIGMGVGAVTSVFAVVDHVLLRPLPYPAPDQLVYLTNGSHNGPTLRGLDDITAFDAWVAANDFTVNLSRADGEPLRVAAVDVTPSFFTMFAARPLEGRVLTEDDYRNRAVAVLTYPAWQALTGGDPAVTGTVIRLNGEPTTVVGVLGPDFVLPERLVGRDTQVFRPMDWNDSRLENPGYHSYNVAARLAAGVGLDAAQGQIDRLTERVAREYPGSFRDPGGSYAGFLPLVLLKDITVSTAQQGLLLLLGSVAMLLLVVCANVGLLFMARGMARMREMSVRRALGARVSLLLGQLALESLLVGLLGGALGLGLAFVSLAGFQRWIGELPRGGAIALDARVFVFSAALAGAAALVFGLLPALQAIRADPNEHLRQSGRTSTEGRATRFVRSGFVVGQVSVSMVLVAVAGLLLRSFLAVTSRDLGLEPANVWVTRLNPRGIEDPKEYVARMDRVRDALEALPEVESATYGAEMPFEYVGGNRCCWSQMVSGLEANDSVRADIHPVSEEFFRSLRIELVAGSSWATAEPGLDPEPVVVNEQLALSMFGSAAAVGRELTFGRGTVRVVGVARRTLHYGLDQPEREAIYLPIEAIPFAMDATFALRLSHTAVDLPVRLRDAVWSVEPDLPVPSVVPLSSWIDDSAGVRRLESALSGVFGAIALVLAAGGLYGTLLYVAGQRRRELGIRMALGAGKGRIQSAMLGSGLLLAGLGVALGVASALLLGSFLQNRLWQVSASDPLTLSGASLVLLTAAAIASWLPAHRASLTDPREVLRAE